MRIIVILVILLFTAKSLFAQTYSVSSEYGRAFFQYKLKDEGEGLRSAKSSNYNFISGLFIKKRISEKSYWRTGLKFTMYQQYFSTRKYWGAFEESFPVIFIPLYFGVQTEKRLSVFFEGGVEIGIMPDQYEGEFMAVRIYPSIDSITRGTILRNFTPVFPLLSVKGGVSYKLHESWKVGANLSAGKGLIIVTEYDIFYNDGSGSNDRHGRQWGRGDYYSINLSVSYTLKNE